MLRASIKMQSMANVKVGPLEDKARELMKEKREMAEIPNNHLDLNSQ